MNKTNKFKNDARTSTNNHNQERNNIVERKRTTYTKQQLSSGVMI